MIKLLALLLLCLVLMMPIHIHAEQSAKTVLRVAVAANFHSALAVLVSDFEQQHSVRVELITGSTGKLAAQILHGAPFDLFFSADQKTLEFLVSQGKADESSVVTYAKGRLTLVGNACVAKLWSQCLRQQSSGRIAIAHRELAPYGRAAYEVLDALQLTQQIQPRLVVSPNVMHVYHYTASQSVDYGFVAYAQVLQERHERVHYRLIPETLYTPIIQDAAVIFSETHPSQGSRTNLAQALLDFIMLPKQQQRIAEFGYLTTRSESGI